MSRRAILVFVGLACTSMLTAIPARAGGGGGCFSPATDGVGAAVTIRDFCYAPTVLHIQPGDEVTFANRDSVAHTVTGAANSWGDFTQLKRGDGVTYRFTESGTYSYYCAYHIGMVGAVVVGDGGGTGAANPVQRVGSLQDETSLRSSTSLSTNTSSSSSGSSVLGWWAAAAMALVAAAALSVAVRGARRDRPVTTER
jgi:plastocyanin